MPAISPVRNPSDRRPSRSRSAVTNGRRLHVRPVGDTAWSRRFKDLIAEITGDLGGADCLSEGQKQLVRRCATISLECERLEVRAVCGEQIDLDCYGQMTDRLGRAFGRLGLKRVPRDITPTLGEYLRGRPETPEEGPEGEAGAEMAEKTAELASEALNDGEKDASL